ncbi:MAG: thioredoxin family protein [Planctomycetia bacterium]|nr:thioredoxin family protein [Planctomycetia bacterium]
MKDLKLKNESEDTYSENFSAVMKTKNPACLFLGCVLALMAGVGCCCVMEYISKSSVKKTEITSKQNSVHFLTENRNVCASEVNPRYGGDVKEVSESLENELCTPKLDSGRSSSLHEILKKRRKNSGNQRKGIGVLKREGKVEALGENNSETIYQETPSGLIEYSQNVSILGEKSSVLLYFHAPWSKNCQRMGQTLKSLSYLQNLRSEIKMYHVDIQKYPEVCKKYQVSDFPTLLFLSKEGENGKRLVGNSSEARIISFLETVKKQNPQMQVSH